MKQKGDLSPLNTTRIPLSREELEQLLESIKTIKYGSLTLIIQDGRVIQIDKNEKRRLT